MKVLKFSASWCGPCKMLSKVIEDAGDKIDFEIESIDIDENMDMAAKYAVRGVPTMVIVDDTGTEIRRKVGAANIGELLDFVKGE